MVSGEALVPNDGQIIRDVSRMLLLTSDVAKQEKRRKSLDFCEKVCTFARYIQNRYRLNAE